MRKLILLIIVALMFFCQSLGQTIPVPVFEKIKKSIALKHPNDFALQEYLINLQIRSYKMIQNKNVPDIPKEKMSSFISSAESEWPEDYAVQNLLIDNQIAAFRRLAVQEKSHVQPTNEINKKNELGPNGIPIDVNEQIKKRHAIMHPGNFMMQEIMHTNDVNAYLELQNYKNNRVPKEIINQIKRDHAINYPDNYFMQKIMLDNDVNSYIDLNY